MRKLLIIIVILLILSSFVFAKLSDEALEEVRKLSYKHYGWYKGDLISFADGESITLSDLEYEWQSIEYEWQSMWFDTEKCILIVSTNKGKWFVEMKKIEEAIK